MDVDFDREQLSVCTTIEQTADGIARKAAKVRQSLHCGPAGYNASCLRL